MHGRSYIVDELDAWERWFDRLDAGPYHAPEYLELLAGDFEHDSERPELFVYGDEDEFVYYPYIRRDLTDLPFAETALENSAAYSDIVSSWYYGGPLVSAEADESLTTEFADAFGDYCAEEGIVSEFVRFDPNRGNHELFDVLEPEFNRETVHVDLTKSKQRIWDEFEKRNRNAIRQAQETDLVVEQTTDTADYEGFYDIYTNAMEAMDASDHYRFPFSFFEDLFRRDDLSTLTVARYDGTVVGGAIAVHDDRLAHDYLRASNPDYWDMRVNNLLCYEMLMEMRRQGRDRFDFQGGRPGVFKFKKGFSTEGRGEFYIARRTHLPEIYEQLTDAATERGIDTDTGYFPAYREEQSN
jgi:serine/alanine adding enzyme